MVKTTKIIVLIILIFSFFLIVGCSFVPQAIQRIFVSATPTNTATPTPTATATATPMPPVSFTQCADRWNCPEAISFYDLLGEALVDDIPNELRIPYNTPLLINQQWHAMDEVVLEETIDHVNWFFRIDGQDYFQESWVKPGKFENQFDPTMIYPNYQWGVVLEGWELGKPHYIEVGYVINEEIDDGWHVYEPGYKYQIKLNVIPDELPTATPTATQTLTPTVTNTPRPTAIPYTSTPKPTARPACDANSTIEIDNTTGGWITLKLKGPASYTYDLTTGVTVLNVCSGSYSYEAWGCGGAYDSGTLGSNEAHEFYCN